MVSMKYSQSPFVVGSLEEKGHGFLNILFTNSPSSVYIRSSFLVKFSITCNGIPRTTEWGRVGKNVINLMWGTRRSMFLGDGITGRRSSGCCIVVEQGYCSRAEACSWFTCDGVSSTSRKCRDSEKCAMRLAYRWSKMIWMTLDSHSDNIIIVWLESRAF